MYPEDENVLLALGDYALQPDEYQAMGDIVFVRIILLAVTPKS